MDSVSTDKAGNKTAKRVIRWVVFIPAAIAFSLALRFAVALLSRAGLGNSSAEAVLMDIFVGAMSFVWSGAVLVPRRRTGTAITLASVYTVLFFLIELFREPMTVEPVSHSVRLLTVVIGALVGLFLQSRYHQDGNL